MNDDGWWPTIPIPHTQPPPPSSLFSISSLSPMLYPSFLVDTRRTVPSSFGSMDGFIGWIGVLFRENGNSTPTRLLCNFLPFLSAHTYDYSFVRLIRSVFAYIVRVRFSAYFP